MTAETLPLNDATREDTRERCEINRGLLDGCAVYLSERDRFPVRTGTFDREISEKFTEFAMDARVFLDIGAAEGFYSVYMLKNTDAKVYSYESSEELSGELLRNLEENTRDGHRLQFGRDEMGSATAGECKTIDEVAAHEKGPVFLKIEANGSEAETLSGAGHILNRRDTKAIIRVTSKAAEQECMWILDEFGFDISIIGPAWWRSIVKDRSPENPQRWIIAEKSEFEGLYS